MEQDKKIFSIVKVLGEYYALGTPSLSHRYNGNQKVKKIVKEKLEFLYTDKKFDRWNAIINVLSNSLTKYCIKDFSYIQFPSFLLMLEIEDIKQELFHFKKNIIISVSLIDKYYTAYCAESFMPFVETGSRYVSSTVYARDIKNTLPENEINLIKNSLCEILYDYTFVEHHIAFNSKISGTLPYNMDVEEYDTVSSKSLPIGLFLFGTIEFFNNEIKVV